MSETTPLIKAALNLRVGVGFDVYRVRKYAAEMPLNEAVELAITECINEGILTEFLQHNRAEVYKVSIFEYDCIFRKNRALAPHERSAVPLGTDHCPVG